MDESESAKVELKAASRLESAIALLSVVAMGLLWMRDLALKGEADRTPATKRMPKSFVRMRSAWRHGQQRTDLSVREFLLALGRLGGHLNRRRDGLPGWQTPWQGWEKLTRMVQGPQRLRTTCREAAKNREECA